eukprot:5023062-Pleurochrysis_carterae.AAC.2
MHSFCTPLWRPQPGLLGAVQLAAQSIKTRIMRSDLTLSVQEALESAISWKCINTFAQSRAWNIGDIMDR